MSGYAEFARFYDQIMGDRSPDIERVRGYIDRFLPSASSLLELGCGTGAMLAGLAKDLTVAGVDRSPEMLARAAASVPGARLVQADMTDFSLGTRFDVVICVFDTLNHLPRFELWLALFDRVHEHLADGGIFVFDVNTTGRLRRLWYAPAFAEDFGVSTVIMDVSPGGGDLSLWRVRIFERLGDAELPGGQGGSGGGSNGAGGGGLFRLHEETIPELGVPLDRIRQALAARFDIVAEEALDGGEVSDEASRVYFACRHRGGAH